ncbi:MAG: hypothetical protein QOJ67_4081, partial [Acidimicrobiaceae bacterium]
RPKGVTYKSVLTGFVSRCCPGAVERASRDARRDTDARLILTPVRRPEGVHMEFG